MSLTNPLQIPQGASKGHGDGWKGEREEEGGGLRIISFALLTYLSTEALTCSTELSGICARNPPTWCSGM